MGATKPVGAFPADVVGSPGDGRAALLGARIRELRLDHGLTLVQLASLTELSHPFLSQLERGLAQPSLGSLHRIAVALDTSPIELVAASEATQATRPAVELRRSSDPSIPVAGFAEGTAKMLAHAERPFHPIDHTAENVEPGELYTHAEDEFAFVLAGNVLVEVEGRVHELGESDSIY